MAIGTSLFGAQMSVTVAGLDFQFSEVCKVLMIVVLASFLTGRRDRIGRLSTIVGRGRPDGDSDCARLPAAGPGDGARVRGDPGRDAVHERREHRLAGLLTGGAIAAAPLAIETLPARLSAPASLLLPGSVGRSAGCLLPAHPVAERGRLGRSVRTGTHGRRPEPLRLPAGAVDRLHLHRGRRGARLPGRPDRARALRAARLADHGHRLERGRRARAAWSPSASRA